MLMRQLDVIPLEVLSTPITIVGAGAVGSFTTLAIAKMGFSNIMVFDDDKVEAENMNAQFYPIPTIGRPKVEALSEVIEIFCDTRIEAIHKRYSGGALPGIVISAVDNMKTRRLIWEEAKRSNTTTHVIDPRMTAQVALLYTMKPMVGADILSYEKTLYSDEVAVQERCTEKSTIYTVLLLSGLVCQSIKAIVTKTVYPRIAMWDLKALDLKTYTGGMGV